jgi:ankyrin repeat protein
MGHMTPLMHATFLGKLEAVKYLWNKGADRTIPEAHGYLLMDAAAYAGKSKIVKFFIDQGMDPNEVH